MVLSLEFEINYFLKLFIRNIFYDIIALKQCAFEMFLHINGCSLRLIMLKQETYNRGGCVLENLFLKNIQLNDVVYLIKSSKKWFLFLTSNEV